MILDTAETVATFTVEGDPEPYEIDHLGITDPAQWGQYTVYRRRKQLAAFVVPVAAPRPWNRPAPAPVPDEELIELARAAVTPGRR
ncbi:MAG TPA: hypothetical protein VLL08_01475 [Kineosporiaceae bacterium]|nr:hypothetical protein [Kineosporiaceae bacterium]